MCGTSTDGAQVIWGQSNSVLIGFQLLAVERANLTESGPGQARQSDFRGVDVWGCPAQNFVDEFPLCFGDCISMDGFYGVLIGHFWKDTISEERPDILVIPGLQGVSDVFPTWPGASRKLHN
jgi:hypothetical protein